MKSFFIVLGFITTILALILAVTHFSQMAYLPAVAALVFGSIALYISKREKSPKKSVELIFLLTIISLLLTTYKSVFTATEGGNTEKLELEQEASKEDSKDSLEVLDVEEFDIDREEQPQVEGLEDQ